MNDEILWIAAIAIGGIGLLLLGIAGIAATTIRSAAQGRRPNPEGTEHQTAYTTYENPPARGTFWVWIKAGIFAILHAGVVSVVLGGLTFFEDLVRAGREIRRTGTVSFPPQLLPGGLDGVWTPRLLSGSTEEIPACPHSSRGYQGRSNFVIPSAVSEEWKVMEILDSAGPDGEALAGNYRPVDAAGSTESPPSATTDTRV